MKFRFTQVIALLALTSIFFLSNTPVKSAVKRVLLEEHTGAWCGWCVDGRVQMDNLIKKYGDKVVGVCLHNADAMAVQEQLDTYQAFGPAGFPTGTVSREIFTVGSTNAVFLDRGNWDVATDAVLKTVAAVDVGLKYTIDPTTRELTAYCDATFAQSIANEVRFNVIVCEDEVTGVGNGYDQHNYYPDHPEFSSNPYYTQPRLITGYKHMKVARKYLGGTWGQPNSIAASVNSGAKYSYVFTYTIPNAWNIDKIWCAGIVQQSDLANLKFNVLNAITGTKLQLTTQLEPIDGTYQAKNKDELAELNLSLKNISNGTITYLTKLDKSARTPSDWTATLEGANGDLPVTAGSNVALKINLTPGATQGVGDATLTVWDKAAPSGLKYTMKLTVVSNEIEKFQVLNDGENGKYSLKPEFNTAGITGFIDIPSTDFTNAYSSLSNVKTVVWNTGEMGEILGPDATTISSLMSEDKGLLITGARTALSLKSSGQGILSTLGIAYDNACQQGKSTLNINLKGYTGDPITDGFTQPCVLKSFLTPSLKVNNTQVASPILRHSSVDTIVATRAQLQNSRVVFLSINPAIVGNNAARNGLIKKSLEWIAQGGQQSGPQMALNLTEIQFDKVTNTDTKDKKFRITNEGNQDLIISEITNDFVKDVNHVFSFVGLDNPPYQIAPAGEMEVTVRFSPKKKQFYEGDVTIRTNSLKNADEIISLYGEGEEQNGVGDEAVSPTGLFRMSATPNPASTNATISYTLNGGDLKDLELVLMDLNGKQIASLFSSSIIPGTYSYNLNTTGYVSGNYYIIARIAGESVKLPILIVK